MCGAVEVLPSSSDEIIAMLSKFKATMSAMNGLYGSANATIVIANFAIHIASPNHIFHLFNAKTGKLSLKPRANASTTQGS